MKARDSLDLSKGLTVGIYCESKEEAEKLCSMVLSEITINPFSPILEVTSYYMEYGLKDVIGKYCVEIISVDNSLDTLNGKSLESYGLVKRNPINKENIDAHKSIHDVVFITLQVDNKFSEAECEKIIMLLANGRYMGGSFRNYKVQYSPKEKTGEDYTMISVLADVSNQTVLEKTLEFYGNVEIKHSQKEITNYYQSNSLLYSSYSNDL